MHPPSHADTAPFPARSPLAAARRGAGVLLLGALLLGACDGASGAAPGSAPEGTFFAGTGPDGARIVLAHPPERILPANLQAAELLQAFVPLDRFAGIAATVFDFGTGFGSRADWGEARVLERYHGEEVLALRPDLVVSGAYQDLETTALLRREGVPVLGLPTVRSLDDVLTGIEWTGRLLGEEERARSLRADLLDREAALAERAERWRGTSALLYTNYGTGGWTQGSGSPAQVLLDLAGLENAAARNGQSGHYQIDGERLLALDPDVIVCSAPVASLGASAAVLREDPVLSRLRAVREGRLLTLPSPLFQTTSQHVVDAAEALADALEEHGLGKDPTSSR